MLKNRVILAASTLLGKLSSSSLDSIVERFLTELSARIRAEASSTPRQEIYDLCHALRFLELRDETPGQLKSAINFLESMFPLKHIASEKKSRLQQALCDVLSSVLAPLADTGNASQFGSTCDHSLRQQWFSTITYLRTELQKWTVKQAKQALYGYPVVTALICLEDEGNLVGSIDTFIEQLHKQMKDRKTCSMALLCLTRSVGCFLKRLSGRSDPERLAKWVARSTQPTIQAAIRGQFNLPEQMILMREICTMVSETLPEYALRFMVLELLNYESGQPWEAPLIGIWALMFILGRASDKVFDLELNYNRKLPPTTSAMEALGVTMSSGPGGGLCGDTLPPQVVENMHVLLAQGHCLFDILGVEHLLDSFNGALEKIRQQTHQLHGYSRLTNSFKPLGETARERASALTALVAIIDCVPYVVPNGWRYEGEATATFIDDFPSYAIHVEVSVRHAAIKAMIRCIQCWPESRNAILKGVSSLLATVDENQIEILTDLARLLLRLMCTWNECAQTNKSEARIPWKVLKNPPFNTIGHVEGCAILLLCHKDTEIRRCGFSILQFSAELAESTKDFSHCPARRLDGHDSNLTSLSGVSVGYESGEKSLPGIKNISHSRDISQISIHSPLESISFGRPNEKNAVFDRSLTNTLPSSAHNWQRSLSSLGQLDLSHSVPSSPGHVDILSEKYIIDIIEDSGDQICRQSYWDFGPHSDITRVWKPVGEVSFESCLLDSSSPQATTRWNKILCEVIKESWIHAKTTASVAFQMAYHKVSSMLVMDSTGRKILPLDGMKAASSESYAMIIVATSIPDALKYNESSERMIEEYMMSLLSSARYGLESAVTLLGSAHESSQPLVINRAASLKEEYLTQIHDKKQTNAKASKGKKDDVRLLHSNILRIISANLSPGSLASEISMRDEFIEYIVNTSRYISISSDVSPELQQIRYCLCVISRQVALQLADSQPQIFPPMLRKQLYSKFCLYSEEGQTPGMLSWTKL